MTARLANNPDFNSNDETDKETVLSTSEESSDEDEDSHPLNNLTKSQKVFGRTTDKKKCLNPKLLEELQIAHNNVDSISELTRFLWK